MDTLETNILKEYTGRVPACGCFCGGCPTYTRDVKPCPGAEANIKRCEGCKTFHLCCKGKSITHCHQCGDYPCKKFKDFRKRWLRYGQDFLENQELLKAEGAEGFIKHWNTKVLRLDCSVSDTENFIR